MVFQVGFKSYQAEVIDWLRVLLEKKYFGACYDHQELKKNELNMFCINCKECLCQACVSSKTHSLHNVLQIRKYVYHDVVRIKDMNEFFNCSKIQQYINNGSRVVFLNSRLVAKPLKANEGPSCVRCERSLAEPNRYCSIACKLAVSMNDESDETDALFPAPKQELRRLFPNENQESESYGKDDSSDSHHAEAEWRKGSHSPDHYLNNPASLRPKHRFSTRKGYRPCRAPYF
ncbi:hypothetical protein IFM89_003026 [Coptis chinensis]|uniref:B box-type domain-containing protein n=1 Tax=Coptis chinensis TaxID=261450 RepID=A0A835IVI7_9MAGN|nr:hypothetical protein IFM89_003026 [Coptis chinensis]